MDQSAERSEGLRRGKVFKVRPPKWRRRYIDGRREEEEVGQDSHRLTGEERGVDRDDIAPRSC